MKDEIIVVLDRSGSMAAIRDDMVGGLQQFVEQQRSAGEAGFTLARFDDVYELALEGVPLSSVALDDDVLTPRGSTALLDAIGKTVTSQGERFAAMPDAERPQRVVLLIVTDGHENSSREWRLEAVKALLKSQQEQWKWAVTFLGCGIDAIASGHGVGVARVSSLSFARSGGAARAAFAAASNVMAHYRKSADASVRAYTEEERKKASDQTTPAKN